MKFDDPFLADYAAEIRRLQAENTDLRLTIECMRRLIADASARLDNVVEGSALS